MGGKIFVWLLATALLTTVPPAEAQQPGKIPRIGFQSAASSSAMTPRADAFRQGLRELGYVEGKNIIIEWRYAAGKLDRLDGVLRLSSCVSKCKVIVTAGSVYQRAAAKKATSTIPIVMAWDNDPLAKNGFIASLARPGGNITGMYLAWPPR